MEENVMSNRDEIEHLEHTRLHRGGFIELVANEDGAIS